MANRGLFRWAVLTLLALTAPASAASFRTANFVVEAPDARSAEEFGKWAEHYRKQKAVEWLGVEMPQWQQPCPLRITITMSGAGGATSFDFRPDRVIQDMKIEGSYNRLRDSVLPHEVTHTVLAHHFRQPVPRWADEGGSVLSEDDIERNRHDSLCRQILNQGRAMPLGRLFSLKEYPSDVMVLYAEGYSVTRFLVESADRKTFLGFVAHGMQYGWDSAARTYYKYRDVAELEQAWLADLRNTKKQQQIASTGQGSSATVASSAGSATLTGRVVVRDSSPPAQPRLDPPPVARGVAPEEPLTNNSRPVRLSDPVAVPAPVAVAPPASMRPAAPPPSAQHLPHPSAPPPVRLGLPEAGN